MLQRQTVNPTFKSQLSPLAMAFAYLIELAEQEAQAQPVDDCRQAREPLEERNDNDDQK